MRWMVVLVVLSSVPAYALNQAKHQQIARDSCLYAGLPGPFCERVGVATYNVDKYEFNDLTAHSQITEGWTACDAANASARRLNTLGAEIHRRILTAAVSPSRANDEALADAIGRALHTLQDNCAHSGMPNPQHAWHSLNDVCIGTLESPDIAPDAISCARWSTDNAFGAILDVMSDNGMEKWRLQDAEDGTTHWPSWNDACSFLTSAHRWNGSDRRWNNDIVDPFFRNTFANAVRSWSTPSAGDVCASAPDGILVSYAADVSVSGGPAHCVKITAFCGGKADGTADELPPYQEEAPELGEGGCSVGGHGSPRAALLLVIGFVAIRLRRRR